jgi:hypothetical protein
MGEETGSTTMQPGPYLFILVFALALSAMVHRSLFNLLLQPKESSGQKSLNKLFITGLIVKLKTKNYEKVL